MPDMKNIIDWINSQLDIAEEKISELDSTTIKAIQNETERKKESIKIKGATVSCEITSGGLIYS